jgi:hypothetical protein
MRIAVILAGFLAISPALAEAGITGRPTAFMIRRNRIALSILTI